MTASLDKLQLNDLVEQIRRAPNSDDLPRKVRAEIELRLSKHPVIVIDLLNMRSLSPSFAYEVFGKLVDSLGDGVIKRLSFVNDPMDLQSRIIEALKRRHQVVKTQS
jgi:hypothetical protein